MTRITRIFPSVKINEFVKFVQFEKFVKQK